MWILTCAAVPSGRLSEKATSLESTSSKIMQGKTVTSCGYADIILFSPINEIKA
jgi:hypothetical protein